MSTDHVPGNWNPRRTDMPTLADMTPRARRIAEAYYEAGYMAGELAGHQRSEDEAAARWQAVRDIVGPMAKRSALTYAELCDKRGDHDRAEAQRALLRERGVTR